MKILPEPLAFDWDEGNRNKNFIKHNVSDKEAEEVFKNKPFFAVPDKKHSEEEKRFQALGKTDKKRLLFMSFTIRNSKVRVISTRNMNKKERRQYEEKIKKITRI